MADVYEKNLSSKSSLTVNDYIRVVGSDNVSYKQLVSDVANKIITTYTGASLAGSNQSVKSALDSLNSNKQPNIDWKRYKQSVTIVANSKADMGFSLDTTIGNLVPTGILGVNYEGNYKDLVLCKFSLYGTTAYITLRNFSNSDITTNVEIKILYK